VSKTMRCDNCGETRDTVPLSLVTRVGEHERASDFCSFSCLAAWSQKSEARWWEVPDEPVEALVARNWQPDNARRQVPR
jgi:hypothetical protein